MPESVGLGLNPEGVVAPVLDHPAGDIKKACGYNLSGFFSDPFALVDKPVETTGSIG